MRHESNCSILLNAVRCAHVWCSTSYVMHVLYDGRSTLWNKKSEHYRGLLCSFNVVLAYNELVCRLNCPNARSHPTDLSVLISPKYTASARVRVHYLCQLFSLNRAFNLEKLILPKEVLYYHTDPAASEIFLLNVRKQSSLKVCFKGNMCPPVDALCPVRWANIACGHLRSKFRHRRDPRRVNSSVLICP